MPGYCRAASDAPRDSCSQYPRAYGSLAEARLLAGGRALIAYHLLYLSAFIVAVVVVSIGCWRVMRRGDQPLSARFPVACIFLGSVGSMMFIGSSIMDLFDRPVLGGTGGRTVIIIGVVCFFFVGLAAGIIRRVTIEVRRALALHLAHQIVVPLWRVTTALHPDVRLPLEDREEYDRLMEISRLTIETHDALRLIRDDDDPALASLHHQHPEDPQLSAGLLRHLSGESSVPSLGRITLALTRLRTLHIEDDEALTTSLTSLYEIRVAMSTMGAQD